MNEPVWITAKALEILELNGCRLTASQEDAANAVLSLAASETDQRAYAQFLKANSEPQL